MMAATPTTFRTHFVRLVIALVISLVTLVVMLFAVRASSALQTFVWYVLPLSVAAGFAPIIRWYGRDAFPIGVIYCPAVFFLLRYLGEVIGRRF
jgi:FtsH-binding integral membrane protein